MKNKQMIPVQCHLWKNEKALHAEGLKLSSVFNHLKTYVDQSHFARDLLKCRDCGQLYFYEFSETVNWDGDNDSQYSTFVPIASEAEAEAMSLVPPIELLEYFPRLQVDLSAETKKETIKWMN